MLQPIWKPHPTSADLWIHQDGTDNAKNISRLSDALILLLNVLCNFQLETFNHDPCSILLSWLCLLLQKDKEIYHISIIKLIQLHLIWHASRPPTHSPPLTQLQGIGKSPTCPVSMPAMPSPYPLVRCKLSSVKSAICMEVWWFFVRSVLGDFECRSDEIVWHGPPIRVAVIMMKSSNFSEILRTRNHINWWKPTDCFLKGKGRPQRLRLFLYVFEPQNS